MKNIQRTVLMMGRTTEQIQEPFFVVVGYFIIESVGIGFDSSPKRQKKYIKNYLPSWMSSDFRNPFFSL